MDNLIVSSSPHIRDGITTRSVMGDVLIALMPCVVASTIFFGFKALVLVAITTATAVLTEYISRIIMKRRQTAQDLSAAVTGVILGLILPVNCGVLPAVFGSVAAIAVVKQMFGGIGANFANPACTARIILLISFPAVAVYSNTVFMSNADAVTSATPLAAGNGAYSYFDLFIGNVGGCVGETCVLAILAGFAYLLFRKVISPVIPLSFIGGAAVMAIVCGQDILYQLMSGGLLFGAVFMATDYATSPISPAGKVVFGVGCGVITMLIRVYGKMPEGVSFSILLMNIIAPRLDALFVPKPFGSARRFSK